jgi:hypothetical protein
MTTTQITRIRESDGSQTLKKQIDGSTLSYSEANLTTMLSGVTNPIYVLKRIDNNGNAYPFTYQARDQTEFKADFETTWDLLLSNPDRAFQL